MKTRQKVRFAALTLSFLLMPATMYYLSPVVPLEGSTHGIVTGSLLVFTGLFAAALLLGRGFCGWVCPAGGLQDITGVYRDKSVRPRRVRWIKYLVWVPWLSGLILFFRGAEGVQRIDFLYATERGLSVTSYEALIAYVVVALVFLGLATAVGKRAACHTICWIAPFMILGLRLGNALGIPSLRMVAVSESCKNCGKCTAACPMSINVEAGVQSGVIRDSDCIVCGSCADACRSHAIRYSFSNRERREK